MTKKGFSMKKKLMLAAVGIAAAMLAGCAGTMQDVNDALKKVNQGMKAATGTPAAASGVPVGRLGSGTGYQPNLTVDVPKSACNQAAFLDGVRDSYVMNWQNFVDMKVTTFRNLSKRKDAEPAVKKNLTLYQSKVIGTANYSPKSSSYPPSNQCGFQGYTLGQEAGMNLYERDKTAVQNEEATLSKPL